MSETAFLAWAGRVHDAPVRVAARRSGDNATVWVLDSPRGGLVLKHHGPGRGLEQERTALRRWAARLPYRTPRVLAVDAQQRLVALTRLAGTPAAGCDLEAVTRQAGRVLRALHELPHDDRDPVPLQRACRLRFERTLARSRNLLDPAMWRAAARQLEAAPLEGARRVPCHRDFGPHNWLRGDEGVGVVDFEHARPDHPLADWVKVLALPAGLRTPILAGLTRGYGPCPGATADRHAFVLAYLLGTLSRQVRSRDAAATDRARAALTAHIAVSSDV